MILFLQFLEMTHLHQRLNPSSDLVMGSLQRISEKIFKGIIQCTFRVALRCYFICDICVSSAEKFVSILERYKIIYHVREVILTPQGLNDLRVE